MGYKNFQYSQLEQLCNDAFVKFGFNEEESKIITDVLLMSDRIGIESHGMQRMYRYYKSIQKGMIKVENKGDVVFETPVSAVIDGADGMGHIISHKAMTMAIEKAKKVGMAMVVVRNSNHYGIAGYYSKMAADQGLLGISCTNTNPIMVPTYGRTAMLGTNPISVAMPADPIPFWFDASTTVVTRGKVEVYNKNGEALHEGWCLDKDGKPSTDAADVLDNISAKRGGGIMPLGGSIEDTGSHKGYGWGMVCELFSSILSMGITSDKTGAGGKGGICHGFIVIDPAIFGDADAIKAHFSAYLEAIRNSPKAEGQERIYTHGEKEVEAERKLMAEGIPVNENTMAEVLEMCQYLGMDFSKYFGDYVPPTTGFKSPNMFR